MEKERLAAFSDGVIAIIITIMVLELKVPHGSEWTDLAKLLPIFVGYVLSFVYVAIYWNNHHHMFQTVHHVNGAVLWANTHLLFWLSLVPFTTDWMGENHFDRNPVILYGVSLLMPGIAYYILQRTIIRLEGEDCLLAQALGSNFKGKISPVLYLTGILATFIHPLLGAAMYVCVAIMWLLPDRRIERLLMEKTASPAD
ncbi:TMEM175 family protein [Methylocella sp. CPCC 101449]|jgi:uncharacterized membrane protein|uniref:TMEM175 family protein n=1 Tax=Methylocella sp. CPCC 101449 TaxID=2987531 RepID=UPI00288D6B23|nr:TMEM175 family protein [Methylocella sp. CPCC 101449]MDT2023606.1 TMEM175 family protein [Methylocella sp. CPCC 101449]HEV2573857.1 TMEM175 family protein [Beijerinckiaceae bacterium]